MTEVLSQVEIDSLIQEIEIGEVKRSNKNKKRNKYICIHCSDSIIMDVKTPKLFLKGRCIDNKYGHVYVLV